MCNVDLVKQFLKEVDYDFPVPLSQKIDLEQLAEKYCKNATLCCEFSGDKIIAMVAGYTENTTDQIGYISLVASAEEARGKGIASRLIQDFLEIARRKNLKGVHVYTHKTNLRAIGMYSKLGFVRYYPEVEPRPDDIHFYYSL